MQLSISFPFFAISSSNDFLNPFDVMLNLRKNSWFVEVSTTCTTAHDSNDRRSFFFPSLILIPQIKWPTAITYHNENNFGLIAFLTSCFDNITLLHIYSGKPCSYLGTSLYHPDKNRTFYLLLPGNQLCFYMEWIWSEDLYAAWIVKYEEILLFFQYTVQSSR